MVVVARSGPLSTLIEQAQRRRCPAGLSRRVEGPHRQLWASRNKGWLGSDDIAEANALLERLCALFSQTRKGERDTLMTLAFVMAPSTARAKRRG